MIAFNEFLENITFSLSDFHPEEQEIPSALATFPDCKKIAISAQSMLDLTNLAITESAKSLNIEKNAKEAQSSTVCLLQGKKFKRSISNPIDITVNEFKVDNREN